VESTGKAATMLPMCTPGAPRRRVGHHGRCVRVRTVRSALPPTPPGQNGPVERGIPLDHDAVIEPLACRGANRVAIEPDDVVHREARFGEVRYEVPGGPIIDDLGHRAALVGDDGRSARHGFHDAEPERLVEADEVQEKGKMLGREE